jgi:hypothetical protein
VASTVRIGAEAPGGRGPGRYTAMTRWWAKTSVGVMVGAGVLAGVLAFPAGADSGGTVTVTASTGCLPPSLLVVSAMPLELDPLLAAAQGADYAHPVMLNNRPFVTADLEGNNVIMGLTGIGPENAQATTEDAFNTFQCNGVSEISGVVFSGTSGGDHIGDVFVPDNWSYAGVQTFPSDPTMLSVATQALHASPPKLEQSTPPGDPACACEATDQVQTPVTVKYPPVVKIGGTGLTTDPFGGRILPCAPTGSDIFGCTPCPELDMDAPGQTLSLAQEAPAFLEPGFFTGYANSTTPAGTWVSEDEETAIVAQVAASHTLPGGTQPVPFIGFRAASDGGGDPLHLPGFPAEFFVYRQLAANNAAATALAFLHQWALTSNAFQLGPVTGP